MEILIRILHFLFRSFELPATMAPEPLKLPQDASSTPTSPNPTPMTVPTVPGSDTTPANPDTLLPWIFGKSLTHNNWHNVRVICDLEGLSHDQKEELTATVWAESQFDTDAVCHNYKTLKDGTKVLASTDTGIAQWNDYYHSSEITPAQAKDDPQKAIRLMCAYWKRGLENDWIAHRNGSYKQHLGKTL